MTARVSEGPAVGEVSKRYLFFLRHFNDTDNIAPIIHAFLNANPGHRAEVLLYDENYSGQGDANLALLSRAFPGQFRWCWLGDHFGLSFASSRRAAAWMQTLRRWRKAMDRRPGTNANGASQTPQDLAADSRPSGQHRPWRQGRWRWLPRAFHSIADVRSGSAGEARITTTLAPLVQAPRRADLVIFDVVRSHHVRGYLKALRALGCRSIICLPVSPLINYNVLREYDFTSPGSREFLNRHDYSGFDALSHVDGLYLNTYRSFMLSLGLKDGLPRRTHCIGSLRYYPEWIRIREAALPGSGLSAAVRGAQQQSDKRLLVLLSRLKTNVNRAELQACLDWLAQAEGFEIRVKGHTRAGQGDGALQLHAMQDANREDTSALIDWCDAVLFWGTSAALEGYSKGKTMICMPFVSSNRNLYAHYRAGFIARCRDDLVLFLTRYGRTGSAEPYDQDGAETMLREVVRSGQSDWQTHVEFTLTLLQEAEDAGTASPHDASLP